VSPTVGLNRAAGPLGRRRDPYQGYNFIVEVDGLQCGGFSRVQGLESSITVEDRVEGGVNGYVHKILKETTYPSLVLTHGLTDEDTLWAWYDRTSRGQIERKNGTIMLLDDTGAAKMWWDFHEALPVKWTGPALDAAQDGQVATESIELVHRGLTRPAASRRAVTTGARVR
jgi:phage tail-like protein